MQELIGNLVEGNILNLFPFCAFAKIHEHSPTGIAEASEAASEITLRNFNMFKVSLAASQAK